MRSVRPRPGEVILVLGGVTLIVLLFGLDWFARPGGGGLTGWKSLITLRWLLAGAVAVALLAALATVSARSPALPMAAGVGATAVTLVVGAALAYRVLVSTPGPGAGYSARPGAYLGLACMLAVVAGALWAIRDERPRRMTRGDVEVRAAPPPEVASSPAADPPRRAGPSPTA